MTMQARALHAITENMLVDRILDLDALTVELQAIAPAALLLDIAELLRPMCGAHELTVEIAPEMPLALVDRARLLQVLMNLVANSARHAPPGTAIVLRARNDGPWVAIDVCDVGEGIPYADRVRVLEKNVRLARDPHGLGLGLFIASSLARAMGGSIAVTDNEGIGCRVVCRIKVAEIED
jgi:signal transduction histidine kinase